MNLIPAPASSIADLAKIDIVALRARQVGLQVMLLNLAQREAKRISRLTQFLDEIEDYLFDPNIIQALSPEQQIQLHQHAQSNLDNSINFVSRTNKEVNIDEIHNRILILQNTAGDENIAVEDMSSVAEAAQNLLKQFTSQGN